MAKVYSPPEELPHPDPDFELDWKEHDKAETKWVEKLKAYVKKRNPVDDTAGEIISFGVADGAAQYMVVKEKPLSLIHLPVGDRWNADPILLRGLRLSDVRRLVHNNRNPLFGRSK